MKRYIFPLIAVILMGCNGGGTNPPKPLPVNTAKDAILMYLAMDNNLEPFGSTNVEEMEASYSEDYAKQIIVYFDSPYDTPKLMRIVNTSEKVDGVLLKSIIIKEYKDSADPTWRPNSSDPAFLEQVIKDTKEFLGDYEIRDILLSSHGTGWIPYGTYPITTIRSMGAETPQSDGITVYSFGSDKSAGGAEMDIDKLADALKRYKFETIIFDACYMSGIETLYQLRDCASFIVASAAEIYSDGLAYKSNTKNFAASPLDPEAVAETAYQYYANHSTAAKRSFTVAVTDTNKLESLAAVVDGIMSEYASEIDNSLMAIEIQQYQGPKIYDLYYDMAQYVHSVIETYVPLEDQESLKAEFDIAFFDAVIFNRHTDKLFLIYPIEETTGVNIYLSNREITNYNNYYKILDWSKDSGMIGLTY